MNGNTPAADVGQLPPLAWALFFALLIVYFAPSLAALWRQVRRGREPGIPLWALVALNLIFAGVPLVWLALWPFALGLWRLPSLGGSSSGWQGGGSEPFLGTGWQGGGTVPSAVTAGWQPPSESAPTGWPAPSPPEVCPSCGGKGQTCPSCFGNRGSWELPQTENGTSRWVNCSYCVGGGRVQCGSCGATG